MSELIALSSISSIPKEKWDALLPDNAAPFLRYDFLHALEATGCVSPETGWTPSHLLKLDSEGTPTLVLPAYIKDHSYGEYVFDWQWAEAYASYGMQYYPKLLIGIPFTPVPSPRWLGNIHSISDLSVSLSDFCTSKGLTGWHMNFPNVELPDGHQASERQGCQFIWRNKDYRSFDDFLASFASRKRKNLLKERRRIPDQGLHVARYAGSDITPEMIDTFYQCYCDTYYRRRSHPYLTASFFQLIRETMSDQLMLVLAEDEEGPCAAALCFFDEHALYGRYWGCLRDYDALHFEACYYQGIEFCIEQGLTMFNPGTQGEHKIARGFAPEFTRSYHWLAHSEFNNAIAQFTRQEAPYIAEYAREAAQKLPFKQESS
ncbi:MAG: GNAT family N-acetyltransferase [Pseudomonadota bacterium]|nr:GNAT family N-acetyltransferase [Pseudomonadota bacterium]